MMLSVAASSFAENVEINGIGYELVKETHEAIVISKDEAYSGNIVIPATFKYDEVEYSVTSIGDKAFEWCSFITSITIPNSVTSIGEYAFQSCYNLTSLVIPNSVTRLGNYAFNDCHGLTFVKIPNSLTKIVKGAFAYCSGLTSIEIPNSVTSIEDYAFAICSSLTSINIPNSVTSIGYFAFQDCSSLSSIEIPYGVTSIGNAVFTRCSGLTSVTIPSSVTSIENFAFRGCSGLTSIEIPSSVTYIGYGAFEGCSGLTYVTIDSGWLYISEHAFSQCSALADMYCFAENVPTTEGDVFYNTKISLSTLHVPDASVNAYSQAEPWKNFKEIVGLNGTIPEKCATPTINKVDGKLKFTCETEGVTFKTTYKVVDSGNNVEGDEVVVGGTATCQVSVYATKEGYEDSDVATANVEIAWGKKGDVNQDGEVNVGDIVTTTNIMAGKDE